MARGSNARASGTNDFATANSNSRPRSHIDGSGTKSYHSGSNVRVTGTTSQLPAVTYSAIDRGVSKSSTNAAERDDNISDFDTDNRKRHGTLRDRRACRWRRQ